MNVRLTAIALVLPWLAPAADAAARWEIRPTLVLSARHDDNPFLRPEGRDPAANLGAEPFLVVARRTSRATWSVSVAQAAERYARHPDIDTLDARQSLALHADVSLTRRWTGRLDVSQRRTASAGELTSASGVDLGRRAARRRQLTSATTYAMSRTTALTGELAVIGDTTVGAPALTSTVGGVRMDHRAARGRRVSARYEVRRHDFEGRVSTSHRLGLGVEHPIGKALELTAFGGPRFSRPQPGFEWQIGARFRTRGSELGGEWTDTESAVVGASGPAFVRRATITGATSFRAFHVRVALDRAQTRGAVQATLLRGSFETGYRLSPVVSIAGLAARTRQQDDLFRAALARVHRTVVEIRLVVTPRTRRREGHVGG